MDWENLKYFLALSRAGSITQAAEQLRVNYSTVARRISQLEEGLNSQLFDRLSSGVQLTADGREMLRRAEKVEGDLLALEHELSSKNQQAGGLIVLAVSHNLSMMLMRCLKEFLELYPAIHIELLVGSVNMDIETRQADLSVRCSQSPPGNVIGKKISSTTIAPYARKFSVDRAISFAELAKEPWVVWDSKRLGASTDKFNQDFLPDNSAMVLSVSDANAQLQAVKEGVGVAWLWRYVGDNEPTIEIVSKDYPQYHSALWVLMHKDLRQSYRHRLLYEHLSGALHSLFS